MVPTRAPAGPQGPRTPYDRTPRRGRYTRAMACARFCPSDPRRGGGVREVLGVASRIVLLGLAILLAPGCATSGRTGGSSDGSSGDHATLAIFDGETGARLRWADLVDRAASADAIFVGERHDDPIAHEVQRALFEDVSDRAPGTALALEHLERDEQPVVDRYMRGEIARDAFIDATGSRDWAGKDTWVAFFQPLVDAARARGAPVIAANAPREYVRRARIDGLDVLDALEGPARATFDVPILEADDPTFAARWHAYMVRFHEFMSDGADGEDGNADAAWQRSATVFQSQSTWDATMGASAADALARGAPKVVLCAGCFHVERDGGTVLQFEARRPKARVLTVTVIDDASRRLRREDRGAADVVIYGATPAGRARDRGSNR